MASPFAWANGVSIDPYRGGGDQAIGLPSFGPGPAVTDFSGTDPMAGPPPPVPGGFPNAIEPAGPHGAYCVNMFNYRLACMGYTCEQRLAIWNSLTQAERNRMRVCSRGPIGMFVEEEIFASIQQRIRPAGEARTCSIGAYERWAAEGRAGVCPHEAFEREVAQCTGRIDPKYRRCPPAIYPHENPGNIPFDPNVRPGGAFPQGPSRVWTGFCRVFNGILRCGNFLGALGSAARLGEIIGSILADLTIDTGTRCRRIVAAIREALDAATAHLANARNIIQDCRAELAEMTRLCPGMSSACKAKARDYASRLVTALGVIDGYYARTGELAAGQLRIVNCDHHPAFSEAISGAIRGATALTERMIERANDAMNTANLWAAAIADFKKECGCKAVQLAVKQNDFDGHDNNGWFPGQGLQRGEWA